MAQQIQAIRLDVQDIGKHVKASKKRFSWTFGLNGRHHTIILDFSFISGKVKLIVDRKTMLESQLPTGASFQHPFTLDGYALNILQQGQTFQLRINNKVFSHLYNQAKTNTQFKNYQDEVKDIKVNESNFQNSSKTVKLNIGALDGGKKKAKQQVQSQNWGKFGNQMSMPSFFNNEQPKIQKKQSIKKGKSLLDEQDSQTASGVSFKKTQQQPIINKPKSGQIDFFAENTQPVLTSPSQQHLDSIIQKKSSKQQQFNTMQQMFSTMNINTQPVQIPQNKPEVGLDLLGGPVNTPTQPQVSPSMDFNTMQKMFTTNSNTQQLSNPGLNPTVNPLANITPNMDFNTMQNMFATSAQNPTLPVNPNVGVNPSANVNNFYSMYNLFTTGNNPVLTPPQAPTLITNTPQITPAYDYNTMQNFFATSSNMPTSQMAGPTNNIANVNQQEFNTMQNLFKTSGNLNLGTPAPVTTSVTTTVTSTTDPFNLMNIASTTTPQTNFNTYSGASTLGASSINAGSFGTMQQSTKGAIDFFSLAETVQASDTTNFSKKKQPSNDLI